MHLIVNIHADAAARISFDWRNYDTIR